MRNKTVLLLIVLSSGFSICIDAEPSAIVRACANLPGAYVYAADSTAAQVNSIATSYRATKLNGNGGSPSYPLCASNSAGTIVGLAIIFGPGNTGHFCSFGTVQGGSCIIRLVDGLPVELMSFSVDDEPVE